MCFYFLFLCNHSSLDYFLINACSGFTCTKSPWILLNVWLKFSELVFLVTVKLISQREKAKKRKEKGPVLIQPEPDSSPALASHSLAVWPRATCPSPLDGSQFLCLWTTFLTSQASLGPLEPGGTRTGQPDTTLQVSPQTVVCSIFLEELIKRRPAVMEELLDLESEHTVLVMCPPFKSHPSSWSHGFAWVWITILGHVLAQLL